MAYRNRKPVGLLTAVIILVIFLPIAYFVSKNAHPSEAAWFDDTWAYRQTVPVTNAGSSTTNQYVKVTLDTATLITAGKMQSDCDDIRITNIQGKLLTHFVDGNSTYACNDSDTSIYLLMGSLPASGTTVYVYYGKNSVSNIEPILGTDQYPGLSCRTIKEHRNNGTTDGLYYITPTGNLSDKIQVYCNMTANNGGGWTLMFQRRGGNVYHNAESCQANLNAFLRNTCGSVTSLAYDASYSIDLDKITNYGEFLISQYDSNLTLDTDDAYIIRSSTNIFPDSIGVNNDITVTSICDVNNANCDTTDAYFKYIGNGWYGSALCNSGYSTGPYLGNYGYCQNGVATAYASNGLFGNRGDYSEAKLWAHDNTGDDYMERTYVRESTFSFSSYTAGSPTNEEKSPAPIAYWKFDEGYGTTPSDSSGHGYHGSFLSVPVWKTEDLCVSGKCLAFDNVDDGVSIANQNFTSLTNFSMSSWIKVTGAHKNYSGTIMSSGDWNVAHWAFSVNQASTALEFKKPDGSSWYSKNYTFNKNQWYHVAVSRSGTTLTYYVDGNSIGTSTIGVGPLLSNATNTTIGRETYAGGYFAFNGWIDEPKIYPYARTAAQIKSDYASKGSATSKGTSVQMGTSNKNLDAFSKGLVGYWKMDEAATPSIDSSRNGNSGTWAGSTVTATGKYGNSVSVPSNGSYISAGTGIPLDLTGSNLTISAWIYFNGCTSANTAVVRGTQYWLAFYQSGSVCQATFADKSLWSFSSFGYHGSISTGTWHHVVVTKDPNYIVTIYVDGVSIISKSFGGTITTESTNLYIGGNGATYALNGKIDEVRIYNRALSPKEVRDLYNWAPGPIGYWNFDEKTGTSANDISGNGNTGSLGVGNSAPSWASGKFGGGLTFDGANDYLYKTSPSNVPSGQSARTISAWIKPNNVNPGGVIVAQNNSAGASQSFIVQIGYIGGSTYLFTDGKNSNNNITISGSEIPSSNSWHHIAFTFDGSTNWVYYLDGRQTKTGSFATTINTVVNNIEIGRRGDGVNTGYHFPGFIDDVRIYNYARTPGQIIEDMNAGHPLGGSPVGSQIAYYKFDEGYGTTANNIGVGGTALNGSLGVGNSAPTWSNSGKFGKALSFDGNDKVDLGSAIFSTTDANQPYTLTAWIKTSSGSDDGIITQYSSSSQRFGLRLYSGKLSWWKGGSYLASSTKSVNDNAWHYIAATKDSSQTVKLYIDGVFDGTGTDSGYFENTNTYIGIFKTIVPFTGLIDEVKIYNTALTADEILLDYNHGSAMVLGSTSTTSAGAPDNSSAGEYCIPGSSDSCSAPAAEWKMDEGTGGSAYDTSGNNNTGSLGVGNSAPTWSIGKIGKGLKFDGSNDYVNAGDIDSLDGMSNTTISFWIKPNSQSTTYRDVLGKWNSGNYTFYIENVDTNFTDIAFGISGSILGYTTSGIIQQGVWTHILITFNGAGSGNDGKLDIYVNGKSQPLGFIGTLPTSLPSSASPFRIGGNENTARYFNGSIDQVRIYNYARTPAQIAWDYNRGAPVGHWKLDECQDITANDSSGNGNNGTITIGSTVPQTSAGTCTDGLATSSWYNGRVGKYNSSLNFDGVDDMVNVSTLTGFGGSGTVSMWVKYSGSGNDYFFDHSGHDFLAYTTSNGLSFFPNFGADATDILTLTNISWDTNWHHLVFIADDSTNNIQVYFDGISKGSTSPDWSAATVNDFIIGADTAPISYDFQGQIDDVRIYNYALTPTQIKTLYNGGAAVQFAPSTGAP